MYSRDELDIKFDENMVILSRLEQERIFTTEWVKRIEERVANLELKRA